MAARNYGQPRRRKRPQGNRKKGQPKGQKRRKRPSALYDPSVPLSGKTLKRVANRLTNLEFGSERRALNREEGQATRQGTALADRASDYYLQLAREQQGAIARQQALGTELQTRLGKSTQESQAALSQIDQEAAKRAAEDAALRGAGNTGGPSKVADEVAAARALSATGAQSAREQAALSSADWANLQGITDRATGMRGGEVQQQLLNQLGATQADIRGRRGDLASRAAGKRAENVLNLRQQSFENVLAARGLDIDMEKIRADLQESRGNQRLARQRIKSAERQNKARIHSAEKQTRMRSRVQVRGQNVTVRGQNITSADRRRGQDVTANQRAADRRVRKQIAGAREKKRPAESSDSRKTRVGIGNAIMDISNGHENRVRRDAPPIVYQAGKEINEVGFIRPSTIRQLKAAGVRIPQSWLPPSQRRGYKAPRSHYRKPTPG